MRMLAFYILNSGLLSQLESVRNTCVNSKIGAMLHIATALACVLCAFSLLKFSNDYLSGKGIDAWTILRPLVILALCANFNTFVATPLHGVVTVFTGSMQRSVNYSEAAYFTAYKKYLEDRFESLPTFQTQRGDAWADAAENSVSIVAENVLNSQFMQSESTFVSLVRQGIEWLSPKLGQAASRAGFAAGFNLSRLSGGLSLTAFGAVTPLLHFIAKLIYFCMMIYCYFYLVMLMLVGPFVFAFSILPSMHEGIKMWVARYIQTCFWVPVGQLVLYVNYVIMLEVGKLSGSFSYGTDILYFGLVVVSIMNILSIPAISGTIIESSGMGGAEDRSMGGLRSLWSLFKF